MLKWDGVEDVKNKINLARVEVLIGLIVNESLNTDKKLQKIELRKILAYYKEHNMKSVNLSGVDSKKKLACRIMRLNSLFLLKVLVKLYKTKKRV